MRSIKFRCWNGEKFVNVAAYARWKRGILVGNYNVIFEQFTGLHDSKETPIYEGDILQIEHFLFYVTFDHGCFVVKETKESEMLFALSNINEFSLVVSNIHETKDFLEPNK